MKKCMRRTILPFALLSITRLSAQEIYFPPTTGTQWETVDPASLGWCTENIPPLLDFLGDNNTKAFIILKDGRIAIEEYYGTFTQDSAWYWASAGKSLTAFLVGIAQADGLVDIDLPSSTYLGEGWTSCTQEQEAAITVRNQLTMTTGLDDGTTDTDCTDPACLQYLAPPGTRWAYHNAPYTKLDGVLQAATGQNLNSYVYTKLGLTTGMLGLYAPLGYNNVFFSTPRSMARFGLLALNRGVWTGNDILGDDAYFEAMTTPSQTLNNSYGYLWWLNGQPSFMAPGSQIVFPGELAPNAPADMFSALGKNGQQLNVVPSQGLVVVRMGDVPQGEGAAVAILFNNNLWGYLNDVICTSTGVIPQDEPHDVSLFPFPASDLVRVNSNSRAVRSGELFASDGRHIPIELYNNTFDVSALAPGMYISRIHLVDGSVHQQRLQVLR